MDSTCNDYCCEVDSKEVVLDEVYEERVAQDQKWGEQNHPDGTGNYEVKILADQAREWAEYQAKNSQLTWADILREEFWEALAETDPKKLREELIQVAAVAVAWVEAIDRRGNDS